MIDLDAVKAAGPNSRENSERLLAEHRAREAAALPCCDCGMATKWRHWACFSTGCRGCVERALAPPPSGPGGG